MEITKELLEAFVKEDDGMFFFQDKNCETDAFIKRHIPASKTLFLIQKIKPDQFARGNTLFSMDSLCFCSTKTNKILLCTGLDKEPISCKKEMFGFEIMTKKTEQENLWILLQQMLRLLFEDLFPNRDLDRDILLEYSANQYIDTETDKKCSGDMYEFLDRTYLYRFYGFLFEHPHGTVSDFFEGTSGSDFVRVKMRFTSFCKKSELFYRIFLEDEPAFVHLIQSFLLSSPVVMSVILKMGWTFAQAYHKSLSWWQQSETTEQILLFKKKVQSRKDCFTKSCVTVGQKVVGQNIICRHVSVRFSGQIKPRIITLLVNSISLCGFLDYAKEEVIDLDMVEEVKKGNQILYSKK